MLNKLSIRAILTSALVLFFVLFAVTGAVGYRLLESNRVAMNTLLDNNVVRAASANSVALDLMRARLALLVASADLKDGRLDQTRQGIGRAVDYIALADKNVLVLTEHPDPSEIGQPLYNQMVKTYAAYRDDGLTPYLTIMRNGDFFTAGEIYADKVLPLGAAFSKSIQDYTNYVGATGQQMAERTENRITFAMTGLAMGLALVLLIMLGLYALFARSVFKPLHDAAGLFDRIARGDLTKRSARHADNEIGRLYAAVGRMQDGLRNTVSAVRTGVDEINTGAREIAMGNTDLSSRTEQQAASLEESAASMEELAASVKLNADSSRQASHLAAEASQTALRGGEVVNEVVGTMRSISQSAKRISEIVGVIDGIAFQTNILALNAAVEAARAGEQGKGFAVVATEVRSLAQRSGQAAKEIKTLIDDSLNTVSVGSAQAEGAGATMQDVVTSFSRVADIISEISAASAEQSSGIQQVNQAVSQMDSVTQQNAALVEEAAAAAASLEVQAAKLRDAVAVFVLDSDHDTSATIAAGKEGSAPAGYAAHSRLALSN